MTPRREFADMDHHARAKHAARNIRASFRCEGCGAHMPHTTDRDTIRTWCVKSARIVNLVRVKP